METVLTPPLPFKYDENSMDTSGRNADWTRWKKGFEIYFKACQLKEKSPETQINILLHIIGEQCREVVDQSKKICTTQQQVIDILDEHFKVKKNVTVERHKFFTRGQFENESIDQYIFELRKLALSCEFNDLMEDLIKDRLVCGVNDAGIRERLLREEKLTLEKAQEICRIAIVSKMYSENIKQEFIHEIKYKDNNGRTMTSSREHGHAEDVRDVVNALESRRASRGRGRPYQRAARGLAGPSTSREPAGQGAVRHESRGKINCTRCGRVHGQQNCPAFGKQCLRCLKMNHFARACGNKSHSVYCVQESEEQVINSINKNVDYWSVKLKINNKLVCFKLDSGADVNVLPLRYLSQIGVSKSQLLKSDTRLSSYSGETIEVIGKINLRVYYKKKLYALEFKVADVQSCPILSKHSCLELDLLRRVMSISVTAPTDLPPFLSLYEDVFNGIGCLPGQYSITLKDDAEPVIHAPRKLPFAIRDDVRKKLLEMESQKIIEKVEGPSEWVSSITVVKKANGDLRICLDPKELNNAIKREHFRLPSLDEIVSNLSGAKYFSTLDAYSGFWQVALDESSSLCTFNTPFGRYKFLRMPYGICSASEVFHKKIYENFDDIEGVCMYIDDLLIFGRTRIEHDERLKKVLERCRKINLKLNKDKCKFGLDEIKYLGHRISKNGLYPDDSHLTAITNMPSPKDKKDVERFLGLVTYVGAFIPNLSDRTLPLRELLKKETEWHWDERHNKCIDDLKKCLMTRPVLQYYCLKKPIVLSVDASKTGLGACLMQNNLPVCYASKALTKTEQRYAQIEKELYACVFACERFHAYIYGRVDVTVETDHKPLISIFKKPIVDAPLRLQRMLLRLQRYTFRLIYKPGRHLHIADALSRAYEPCEAVTHQSAAAGHEDESSGRELDEVCAVVREAVRATSRHISDVQFINIQKHTEIDDELVQLKKYILQGWPIDKNKVVEVARTYWTFKESLSVAYGLVWKDNRVVIPRSLRKEMLNKIHLGHMGLEKCKLRAREAVFWPNINKDLSNLISNCDVCLSHRKNNQKEELKPHEIPDRPWAKVGVDLFQLKGRDYLLLVDYYSKFFEIVELQYTTAEHVINCLINIFSRQGIPNVVMSDCGPQFSSFKFKEFSRQWQFCHVTSSPYYPQSNGQIERTIQTVKNIMIKTSEDGTDYRLALLECLNTPLDSDLASPAELLQSRKLRGIVPVSNKLLQPKLQRNVKNNLIMRQNNQKFYYDKKFRNLSKLCIGQKVKFLDVIKKQWISGTISRILSDRSYEITYSNGRITKRNRRHIRLDSRDRHDTSNNRYNFDYDDICIPCSSESHADANKRNVPNYHVTRFGRTVRPPNRWGFTT
ncbi:hypothetical protein ABMA27_008251 [Loxostege sticticalis]|uniref:RNA-directed DNA polymerase n=1 Tax=Loxostege sticticalis TaxID=481309 RepID=A0ABR3HAM0_LOXSC